MVYWAVAVSAVLLGFERLTYFWVARRPSAWAALCRYPAIARLGQPVQVLEKLFYVFKLIQVGVFLGWCALFAGGFPLPSGTAISSTLGVLLIGAGLVLNYSVFRALGSTGVFYGRELGHEVPWVRGFPFSVIRHPQYIGSILSIWGFFLIMRFPHEDWIVLPLLETAYYAIGAYHEP